MKTAEAIDIVVSRNGRPYEDDWDLLEAAEALASEVAALRKIVRDEAKLREESYARQPSPYSQGRLHEIAEIQSRFNSR